MNVMPLNLELSAMPLPSSERSRSMELPVSGPAYRSLHAKAVESPQDKAREAATSYVASAFLMPVLASLHESPFELKPPFAPGTAEKRFSTMFDQQMADRIAQASNFGLVEQIVNRYASTGMPAPLPMGKEFVNVRA